MIPRHSEEFSTGNDQNSCVFKQRARAKIDPVLTHTFTVHHRFSRDVDTLDNVLWSTLYESFITIVTLMGTMVLIIIVFPWLMLAIVPLMALYWAISVYYRSTSREVKRLDSNMRSHLYAYFSECLTGLGTLKAYNMVHKAILKNEYRIDLNNRPYYLFQVRAQIYTSNGGTHCGHQ